MRSFSFSLWRGLSLLAYAGVCAVMWAAHTPMRAGQRLRAAFAPVWAAVVDGLVALCFRCLIGGSKVFARASLLCARGARLFDRIAMNRFFALLDHEPRG